MPDIQQTLLDFDATIKAKPNLSAEELMAKFPEFNNDPKMLQSAHDYSATLNSGKYDSHIEVNSKFPEFFSMPTPGGIPIPKEINIGGQSGQSGPLTDQQAIQAIYGNVPGTTKIGDVSLLPIGGNYQDTKDKAAIQALPTQQSVAVPEKSVYGNEQQLVQQTSTYDPIKDNLPKPTEYEQQMYNQAQGISKRVEDQSFNPQFYKDLSQGAINSLTGIGGSSLKGTGDLYSKLGQLTNIDFYDNYGKKLQELGEKANTYVKDNSNASAGQKIGGILPLAGATVADIATGGALTPVITGAFAASGYGDGLTMYDEVNQGQEKNEFARTGAGLLYGAVMAGASNYLVEKTIPKGVLSEAVQSVFKSNPELLQVGGEAVINSFAKAQPTIVKQLIKNTLHGVGTIEAMELSKNAIDELYGKHRDVKEWINTATQAAITGVMFSTLTSPFSIHAQTAANNSRRNAQRQVTLTFDEKGNPIEVLSSNKGLTPNGKEVKLSEKSLNDAYTLTTEDFNNAILQHKTEGKATIDDRKVFSNNVANTLKKFMSKDGVVTVSHDENGNALYVISSTENGYKAMNTSGELVDIPKESNLEKANVGDVHQSIMSEYDKSRNYDPREGYQRAIENTDPETVVNPTIPPEVNVTDPTSHIQSGISVIQAKQAMDKQLEGSGITFSEEVVKSDPEMQKRVLDEVMQDTELSDIQKESIVSYVAAEAKARKLQEADRANTETQIQQAGQNLVINPTTNTVVTVRLKGTDEKTPPFVIKSGLSVIQDENGEHAVDSTNSDEAVYYVDADGNTQVTTAENLDIVTNTTPEESISVIQTQLMQDYEQRQQVIAQGMEQYATSQSQQPTANNQEYNTDEFVRLTDGTYGTITNVTPEGYEITADNGTTKMIAQTAILPEKQISGMVPGDTINYIDDNGDQQSGIIQIDPTLRKQGIVLVNDQEVPIENIIPLQEPKEGDNGDGGNTGQKISYPTLKDGTPDFNSMNDEQVYAYTKETKGEEAAQALIGRQVKRLQGQIGDNQRATNSLKEETNKLLAKAKNMQEEAAIEAKQESKGLALKQQHEDLTAKLASAQSYLPKVEVKPVVETPAQTPKLRPEYAQLQKQEAEKRAKVLADQIQVEVIPTIDEQKADIERRRQETLNAISLSSSQMVKYNPEGENIDLSNEEAVDVNDLITQMIEAGKDAQTIINQLTKWGYVRSINNSIEAQIAYIQGRIDGTINTPVNSYSINKDINAKFDKELAALKDNEPIQTTEIPAVNNQIDTVVPVEENKTAEVQPKSITGWHTTKDEGSESSTQIQSSGLPVGKFVALDKPFTSTYHKKENASRVTVNVQNTYNPDGKKGFPKTEDVSDEMVKYVNTHKELRFEQAMTNFYKSKGYDSYVRDIDGIEGNRELIVFDESKIQNEKPIIEEIPKENLPEQTTKGTTPFQKRQQELGEYLDMEDFILRAIAGGQKFKWKTEGLKKGMADELGFGDKNGERLQRRNLIDEQNGLTPTEFSHSIWNDYGEDGNGGEIPGVRNLSDHEILNLVNEVLLSTKSNSHALEQAEAKRNNYDLNQEDYGVYESFTPEELNYLEQIPDDILEGYLGITNFTSEQLDFITTIQNEYETNINQKSADTSASERDKSTQNQESPTPKGEFEEPGQQSGIDTKELDNYIAEQEHNTNPTEKQKETGIYAKARVNLQHHNITIETLKGTERTGIDEGGQKWSVTMHNHYGELDGTVGYDNDPIDVFIGPNPKQGQIFVVDQISPDGSFDESKVMLGFDSAEEAKAAYMSNYSEGWDGFKSITPAGDNFKEWLYDGKKQKKPFAEYKDTPEPHSISFEETPEKTGKNELGIPYKNIIAAENSIPKEFKDKISEFLETKKMIQYPIGNNTTVYIYNDSVNKFPTSSIIRPNNIYLNLDHLSDVPYVMLGKEGRDNLNINAYYAFVHELNHIETELPIKSMPDNWDKYIHSDAEISAMKAADDWLIKYAITADYKDTPVPVKQLTPTERYNNSATPEERHAAAVEVVKELEKTLHVGTTPAQVMKSTDDFMQQYKTMVSADDYKEAERYLKSGQQIAAVRLGIDLMINVEHNKDAAELADSYLHETAHKAFDIAFKGEDLSQIEIPNVEQYIPSVYWDKSNAMKATEVVAHQIADLLKIYTPEQIKNGEIDISLLNEDVQYLVSKTLNKLTNGKISISGQQKFNDFKRIPGSSSGIRTDEHSGNDNGTTTEADQRDNGKSELKYTNGKVISKTNTPIGTEVKVKYKIHGGFETKVFYTNGDIPMSFNDDIELENFRESLKTPVINKPETERERILREKLANLGGKLGLKPEFKRTIENILLNGKETGTKIITEQPKERISFIRSVRNDNLPTSKQVWREKDRIKSPTGHVDFDLKNIHVAIYREASETVQNIQELRKNYLFLERNRKGEPVMDLPKAKIFTEGFNYEIEEFARVLSAVKNHSTEPAQQVINDTLESIQVAKKYYEDLANGKDVWRTDPEPQFKRLDSETTDIALDVTEMLFEDGDITFPDYSARMIEALGEGIKPYLSGFYELSRVSIPTQGMTSSVEVANFDIKNFNHKEHVSNRSRHSQPDSPTTNEVPGDARPVPVDGTTSGSVGNGIKKDSGKTIGRTGSKSRGELQPTLFGEQSDNELLPDTSGVEKSTTGDTDGRGNGIDSTEGHLIDGAASEPSHQDNAGLPETFKQRTARKIIEQRNAESIPVKLMDEANVRETLPLLLPEQQDDVLKAEKRFFGEQHKTNEAAYGKGMLFTNGTGTGKTYTGLGVAKRFDKQGKKNILIVVPSEAKVGDWIKDGENIGLTIIPLTSTKDAGQHAVITTYANFRANDALKERDFDLVMYDESHRLMEEKGGATSSTTNSHYAHSNVSKWQAENRIQSVDPTYLKIEDLRARIRSQELMMGNLDMRQEDYLDRRGEVDKMEKQLDALTKDYNANIKPKIQERAKRAYENTKVVFLSATPFKGHFNLRYANGSLFDWGNDTIVNGRGSRVNPEAQFYLNNFGSAYEWKFHRLQTKQKANAEAIAMQEIEFSERLMAQGAMSGRAIESDKDYSREFPLVALEQAEVFNKALNEIYSEEFGGLADAAHNVFSDYNYTTKLFESLKASMNISRIQDHLDLGRKVIVFHRRKQANVLPPFQSILDQTRQLADGYIAEMVQTDDLVKKAELALKANTMRTQAKQFENKYADLLEYEQTLNYDPAINQINEAFPGKVVFLNGDTPKKDKSKNVALFNDDNSGKDIIVVQEESGKEGISLHDTTGKYQRALISLSLPQSSTTTLQIEGRPYRIGNESNAIIEYPLLGLDQEIADFGQKINKRLSTTENLAIGDQARDLLRSFAEGVLFNSGTDAPHANQGKGGKEYDKKAQETLSEFRKAVLVYNTNQKTTGRRDQREGADYYATPEPVGEKMVEWLGLQAGESALEPSAGHGAIAMWFPEKTSVTVVEPSYSLFSKLNARSGGGNRKMLNDVFENLNTINKFEGIAMNPPFGSGGKTAIEHVAKAYDHLRNNGRIVAIIPQGQADGRLDKFLEENNNAHLVASIKLPSVTFEQAGTKVGTRIVVIDRIDLPKRRDINSQVVVDNFRSRKSATYEEEQAETDRRLNEFSSKLPRTQNMDLSYAENVDELFNEIEDLSVEPRQNSNNGDGGDNGDKSSPVAENTTEGKLMPVEEFIHTQTGQQLYNVKINGRSDDYTTMSDIAKKYNPFNAGRPWNKFSKGFLFSDRNDAVKFKNEVEGVKPEYKLISDNGFYSPVENALDKIQQERGTKDQFKAMLLKNGAKQAELDWMGFDELPEKLTKADIQQWIDENRIEVKEVTKSKDTSVNLEISQSDSGKYFVMNSDTSKRESADFKTWEAAKEFLDKNQLSKVNNTKFSQYVLPGGENYKELLLTMPKNESNAGELHLVHKENGMWAWYRGTHQDTGAFRTREQAEGAISQIRPESKFDTSNFHSSHYDEANILAHVRFNERTVNGEKVLFIEEFQSDWAQQGKKLGFGLSDKELKALKYYDLAERRIQLSKDYATGAITQERANQKVASFNKELEEKGVDVEELNRTMGEIGKSKSSIATPRMPFQKTDQWVNLAARRMMRYAVENGFDRIAWTNGEQQADRYSLAEQVDKITVRKDNISDVINKNGERVQGYVINAVKGDNRVINEETMSIEKIEETLGKEIAKGVIDGKELFEGDGLKVGGQGMKAFYDGIVPSAMSKLGKPFGAKVEPINLNTKNKDTNEEVSFSQFEKEAKIPEVSTVQSLPITDEMILSASEGVPMFKLVKPEFTPDKSLHQYAKEINAYNDKIKAIEDRKKELKKEHDDKKISNTAFVSEARKLNDEKFDLETKKKRIEAGTSTPEDFEPLAPPTSGINGGGQEPSKPPTRSKSMKLAAEVEENLPEKLRDELDAKMERGIAKIEFAIQEAYQDQHLAVKLFQDVLKENGLVITPLNDWHRRVSALGGMNDSQMDAYEHRFNLPIMKEVNRMEKISSYRDIENYMMLKHGLERNDFMRAQEAAALEADGKNIPEGLTEKDFSGITAIEEEVKKPAQEFIDEFEALHDTTKLWDLIKKSTTNALKVGYDNGRISKTEYDDIVNRFKYYIPLRGFDKDIAEDKYDYSPDMGTHFVAPLIKAKGRTSRPETPFAYIFSMNHSSITEGNKNNLNQIWVRLARQDKSGLLILKQSWYKKTGETEDGLPIWEQQSPEWNANPEQYDLNIQKFEADMQELAEKKEAMQKRGKLNIGLFAKPKQAKQHEIHVYENGTEHVVYINANPKIARAINGDNRVEAGAFFDGLSVVNRWMAANFTSRNPLFMVTNFERDITFATTTLGVKEGIIYQANFLKNIPVAVKAITNMMIGNGNVQNKYDQYAEEFVMNGGKTGYTHIVEIKSVQKRIENEIKKGKINEPSVVFRLFELGNSVAENTTRLATYITSREAGRSIYEAVSNAKEVTVNFNTKGSGALGADEMKKSFLFFNVAVQALSNMIKTTKENPWRMAGLLASFVATGVLLPLLSRLLGGNEAETDYNNLSDWDRQNNLCIWTGSGYVKWSIPQELRVFHALGDNLYRFTQGKVTKTELAVNTMVGLTDLLPVNPMGAMKTDGKEWKMFANTLTPDLMKPWVQLAINTTYTGGNVFNPYANPSDPGFVQSSKNKKGEPYAPAILVWAAQEMDKQSGGDGVMPGKVSPNPDVINHIMRGYMGGLYTIFVKSVDSGDKLIEGKELKVRDTPISALYTSKEDIKESDAGLRKEYSDVKAAITDEKHYISKYKSGAIEIYRKGGDITKVAEYTTKMQQLSTKKYTMLKFITAGISKLEEQIKDAQVPDVLQQQINKFKKIAIRIDATKDEKELEDIQKEMSR